LQLVLIEQAWSAATKINAGQVGVGKVIVPEFEFCANGIYQVCLRFEIGAEMKIAISTGFPAKGNMYVNS